MSGFEHLLVGQTLGRHYHIDDVLGGGGFGVVFRATDLRPGRAQPHVAVKVLALPAGVDAEGRARLRERFRHEAAFAAALPRHPNVVPIYDYGSDRGFDFLVMELLHGRDLRHRLLLPDPIPLPLALRILRDAARGVAVGHQAGLVHRDVKPANVFLEDEADGSLRVRVLDFGIAKRIEDDSDGRTPTHVTRHGEGFFSGRYASPEQIRRESALTRASDVFSLGVVGFELLTRSRLFNDPDQQRREAGQPVPIPSIVARNAEVPPAVEEVIVRALADDPRERFRDAGAFEEALRQACRASGLRLDLSAAALAGDAGRAAAPSPPNPAPKQGTGTAEPEPTVFAADGATEFAGGTAFAGERTDAPAGGTVFAGERTEFVGEATAFADGETAAAGRGVFGDRRRRGGPRKGWFRWSPKPVAVVPPAPPPPPESERRDGPRPRRWHRRVEIPRTRAMAITIAIFLVMGGALALSAAAASSTSGLLGRIWSRLSGEETARLERVEARDANAEGRRLFERGDFREALERFRVAHQKQPDNPEYHNNVGWALFKLKRGPEAVRVLEAVIARHPTRLLAYENLAAAHLLAGDTAQAVLALESVLSRDPPSARRRDAERLLVKLRRDDPLPGVPDTAFLDPETVVASEGTTAPTWSTPVTVDTSAWMAPTPAERVDTFPVLPVDTIAPPPARADTPARARTSRTTGAPTRVRRDGPRDTLHVGSPTRPRDTVRIPPGG